jgi:hypothetical protein
MSEKLVTVAHFSDYIAADLARQWLEDEDIPAFVMGQNVGVVYSGVPAVMDIELQTPESQAERAREILEAHRPSEQGAEPEDLEDEQGLEDEQDREEEQE